MTYDPTASAGVALSASTLSIRRGRLCLVRTESLPLTPSHAEDSERFGSLPSLSPSLNLDMMNIFETFLPQLLRYPNPNDPLNGEAAALLMRHPKEYDAKVKGKPTFHFSRLFGVYSSVWCLLLLTTEYVQRFATKEAADNAAGGEEEEPEAEMSDIGSISEDEMEA